MRSLSSRLNRRTAVASTFALLCGIGAVAGDDAPARAGLPTAGANPDYASVGDPLGGTTSLLRDDDLFVDLGVDVATPSQGMTAGLSSIVTASSNGTFNSGPTVNSYYDEGTPITGRFFRSTHDALVQLPMYSYPTSTYPDTWGPGVTDFVVNTFIGTTAGGYQPQATQEIPWDTDANMQSLAAVADFNGDGYDDIVVAYADKHNQFPDNGRVRFMSAANLDNPTQGLKFSNESVLGISNGIRAIAAGDFNGDGRPDFAVLYIDDSFNLTMAVYSVDASLVAHQESTTVIESISDLDVDMPYELRVGNFGAAGHQQLALASRTGPASTVKVRVFDFAGNYTPVLEQTLDTNETATSIKMVVSKLAWSSVNDSIALMVANTTTSNTTRPNSYVSLVSVDPVSFGMTISATLDVQTLLPQVPGFNCVAMDIAVGNFDNQMPSPVDASVNVRNPDMQLAISTGWYDGTKSVAGHFWAFPINVSLFNTVDPKTGKVALVKANAVSVAAPTANGGRVTRFSVGALDLQGRSLRLGSGYKITMDKASPTLVLAQPPSHIDYATPVGGSSPTLVDVSLAPTRYNAQYLSGTGSDVSSTSSTTNGWGFAGKESIATTLTFGETNQAGALTSGTQISQTFTAQQAINESNASRYGTDAKVTSQVSSTTRTGDQVWYDDGVTYAYVYEVAGRTVCPNNETTCDDTAKVPLTVMFSAPGASTSYYLDGTTQAWYQPIWENGNLMSYPGSSAQILAGVPYGATLNSAQTLATDASSTVVTTSWQNTTSEGSDVTNSSLYSANSETTVSNAGGVSAGPVGFGIGSKIDINVGASRSFQSLRTSTSTLTNSGGLTITKGAGFPDFSSYGYYFSPVIYGQQIQADGMDGTDPSNPNSGLTPTGAGIAVGGAILSGYSVDPLKNGSAFWPNNYGSAPDIALNHPDRFMTVNTNIQTPIPANCLNTGVGYMDCAYTKTRSADLPMSDDFHHMKGFFVYKASESNPADPTHQGMQQILASVGDQLTLESRVYNYSLAQLPAGAKVKVNFYAMPWDSTTATPVTAGGGSFGIGQAVIDAIPAFNTTGVANYELATVPFDTTGIAPNTNLLFWVVAWAEDSSGNMLGELANKGINSRPTMSTDRSVVVSYSDTVAALEPTVNDTWSNANAGDPAAVKSFSNNIGLYRQVFTVKPAVTGLGATMAPKALGNLAGIGVSKDDVPKTSIALGQQIKVETTLSNSDEAMEVATASFYDGDPAKGGKLFTVERIPYIPAGGTNKVQFNYAPTTCGEHTVYAQVGHSGVQTIASFPVQTFAVTCDGSTKGGSGSTNNGATANGDASGGGGGCACSTSDKAKGNAWSWLVPFGAVIAGLSRRRKRNA